MIFFLVLMVISSEFNPFDPSEEIPVAPVVDPDLMKLPFAFEIAPPPKIPPYQTCDCVKCLPGKECVMQPKCYYDFFCPLQPACVEKCPNGEIWKTCPLCDDVKVCLCGIAVKCPLGCLPDQCTCPPGQFRDTKSGSCVSECHCEDNDC